MQQRPPGAVPRNVVLLVDCLHHKAGHPFTPGSVGEFLLRVGSLIASGSSGRLLLCAVVTVGEGDSISRFSTTAQELRQQLESRALKALQVQTIISDGEKRAGNTREAAGLFHQAIAPLVRVAPKSEIAADIRGLLLSDPRSLLLLPFRRSERVTCPWLTRALRRPLPCDVVWAKPPRQGTEKTRKGAIPEIGTRILIPARGGPQALLALELAGYLGRSIGAETSLLHVLPGDLPETVRNSEEAPFAELLEALGTGSMQGANVRREFVSGDDPASSIAQAAAGYDLVMMGTGAETGLKVGRFTSKVARSTSAGLLALKTKVPVGPAIRAARSRRGVQSYAPEALSILVDKWFAENTFHAREFSDLERLIELKKRRGQTISVVLPALNEAGTIGGVIGVLKHALMEQFPLIDELIVIDSDSTDNTRDIAEEMGVPVFRHSQILPGAVTAVTGKGEALWKSLYVAQGDIIAWVDTDVANMQPQFVYGLVGPLLREPRIGYVKGYYHRPIRAAGGIQHEGGGRVTELTVRPLLNLFFPLLSGLVQPLAGEYAGRREVLEHLPFFSGYGVETGLLIDLLERFGLSSIGQVNLETRVHRNRPLAELSLTSFAIVQVILTRLEERASIRLLEELNRSMKLIRFEKDHLALEVRHVRDVERPPIVTLAEYRQRHPHA